MLDLSYIANTYTMFLISTQYAIYIYIYAEHHTQCKQTNTQLTVTVARSQAGQRGWITMMGGVSGWSVAGWMSGWFGWDGMSCCGGVGGWVGGGVGGCV